VGQLRSALRDPDAGGLLDPAGAAGLGRGVALAPASPASTPVRAGGGEGRFATTPKTAPATERESRRSQRAARACCDVQLPSDARRYVPVLRSGAHPFAPITLP
jgi:hypothetical protein